jgi:integrase/recombinase XerC
MEKDMRTKVDQFLRTRGRRWSPETIDKYRRTLLDLAAWLPTRGGGLSPTLEELQEWLEAHDQWGYSQEHVAICAIRAFYRWLLGPGASPVEGLSSTRRAGDTPPQRTLSLQDVKSLIASLDTNSVKGRRDLAIVILMLDRGLRSSEICRLSLDRLDLERRHLAVIVKGGRWSRRTFSHYTASCLAAWLAFRPTVAVPGTSTVFVSVGGTKPGTTLTRCGLTVIFRRLGGQAGIGRLSPHDLRRTYATLSLQFGTPSRIVQLGGDWGSLAEVERYSRGLDVEEWDEWSPVHRILGLD